MTPTDPTLAELRQRHADLAERAKLEREIQEYETDLMMSPEQARARKIVQVVCAHWPRVSPALILAKRRDAWIIVPRQACYYLCVELLSAGFAATGRFFSKDHGTIIYGHRSITERMETQKAFRLEMKQLETEARKALENGEVCSPTK